MIALLMAIGIGAGRLPEGGLHFNQYLLVGLVLISYAYYSFQNHCCLIIDDHHVDIVLFTLKNQV